MRLKTALVVAAVIIPALPLAHDGGRPEPAKPEQLAQAPGRALPASDSTRQPPSDKTSPWTRALHWQTVLARPVLAQSLPSNPGVTPGTGTGGSGAQGPGSGFSNPGVRPYESDFQQQVQREVTQERLLRENELSRKFAEQMRQEATARYRYYQDRDPLKAKEAYRDAWRWREEQDRLAKQRQRIVQPKQPRAKSRAESRD